jgi:hypothetical protein
MSDPVSDGDDDYKMEDAEEGATFALPEVPSNAQAGCRARAATTP